MRLHSYWALHHCRKLCFTVIETLLRSIVSYKFELVKFQHLNFGYVYISYRVVMFGNFILSFLSL